MAASQTATSTGRPTTESSADRRWKRVRHHLANGLNELYDLKNDAQEQENV